MTLYGQSYKRNNFSIEAGAAYQNSDFRWSIAGNEQGTNPNIYSELIFKPVKSAGLFAKGTYQFAPKFSLQAGYQQLLSFKGSATDFDYAGDNRTNPIYSPYQYLESNKGNMQYLKANINYSIFESNNLKACIGAGYSLSKELYYLLTTKNPALNSTYKTTWSGPLITAEGTYFASEHISVSAHITYNYLLYKATANWNLVEQFRQPESFVHHANGFGLNYGIQFGYKLNERLSLHLNGCLANWQTQKGTDDLYLDNGTTIKSRMNGAFKKAAGVSLSADYSF